MRRRLGALTAIVLGFVLVASPLLADPDGASQMSLLGVQSQTAVAAPAGAPPAAGAPAPTPAGGSWLSQFGGGLWQGFVHAVPDLIRAFRADPAGTSLEVGAMLALGILSPPAALVLGGGLVADALIQTGGDPRKLGEVTGRTAFWGLAGLGAARAAVALRGAAAEPVAAAVPEAPAPDVVPAAVTPVPEEVAGPATPAQYGPFHRLGGRPALLDKMQQTGEIWGRPARNVFASEIPKVKAYDGPLPEGAQGVEFWTNTAPDGGSVPGKPTWAGPAGAEFHKLPVVVTKTAP